jgi:superfamily I DNA and/or RNA helicase
MLDTQYRMPPDVVSFPNAAFYDGRLMTAIGTLAAVSANPIKSTYLKPGRQIAFVNQTHPESHSAKSRQNVGEMSIIASLIEDLLSKNPDLQPADIGVITPYSAQTQYLQDLWRYLPEELANRCRDDLLVNTVDSYQGQERKIIILSTVRSNSFQGIGFLQDPRRLNVALTRAKRALLVVVSQTGVSWRPADGDAGQRRHTGRRQAHVRRCMAKLHAVLDDGAVDRRL